MKTMTMQTFENVQWTPRSPQTMGEELLRQGMAMAMCAWLNSDGEEGVGLRKPKALRDPNADLTIVWVLMLLRNTGTLRER